MSKARVVIESISPQVDCGNFPAKRVVGEAVIVEADVFTDGHDVVSCVLLYRAESATSWEQIPMSPLHNDRWIARFTPRAMGRYLYTVRAWVDHLATWKRDPGSAEAWPFIAQPQSMLMTTRDLSVFREVHLGGETIGTVYIRSDQIGRAHV